MNSRASPKTASNTSLSFINSLFFSSVSISLNLQSYSYCCFSKSKLTSLQSLSHKFVF